MQIALCHENVLPHRGGAEMYVADLARQLAAAGHDLHLYACRWDANALPAGIQFHSLTPPMGPRFLRPWLFSSSVRAALQRDRPTVSIGFDKTFGTDILYPLGGLHAASAAGNLRKRRHTFGQLLAGGVQALDLAHRSFLLQESRGLAKPNRPLVIANSRMVRSHCLQYYGIPEADVPVIPNAIDPGRFNESDRPRLRDVVRQQFGLAANDVVGLHVAMNYRLKGLEPLLRALRRVPPSAPFKLLVAGSSKTRPFEKLARKLGVADRVTFAGHCPDVRRLFFASDLLVHPTFYDPCSLVVLEAFACGLPAITTVFNGASEFVPDGRAGAVLTDPHNERRLASAIVELLDPDRRADAGRTARRAAAGWTFADHARKLMELFATIAARRAAG